MGIDGVEWVEARLNHINLSDVRGLAFPPLGWSYISLPASFISNRFEIEIRLCAIRKSVITTPLRIPFHMH